MLVGFRYEILKSTGSQITTATGIESTICHNESAVKPPSAVFFFVKKFNIQRPLFIRLFAIISVDMVAPQNRANSIGGDFKEIVI
jgi:hypothetical protein